MPGKQGDITNYFSPKPKVEKSLEKSESRKRKNEEETESQNDTSTTLSCLSPDQKKRMLTNKALARIKVASRRLPFVLHENIGASWFAALEPEFQKPYFQKLNDFLQVERNSSVKIFPPHENVSILSFANNFLGARIKI